MFITKRTERFKKALNLSFLLLYSTKNYYEILQIDPEANHQEIKNKYYSLAKKYHPDIAKDQISKKKFVSIQEAYEILGNQNKRKQYDNTYYSKTYGNYNQDQNQRGSHHYHEPKQEYHNYYHHNKSNYENPSLYRTILDNKFKIIKYGFVIYFILEILDYIQQKAHNMDVERRQQMIEMNPNVVERRKKMYKEEMKKKNIYGRIVEVKMRRLEDQGLKAKREKKQSIKSIQGIQKVVDPQNDIAIQAQYI